MSLELVPMGFRQACGLVAEWHRHLAPPRGCKFCLGAESSGRLCGVIIVGRPISRHSDDGATLEVVRCSTDGTPNACSFLLGAAWRAVRALGYCRLLTKTLPEEGGASLRAVGWREVGRSRAQSWARPSGRRQIAPVGEKVCWEVTQ